MAKKQKTKGTPRQTSPEMETSLSDVADPGIDDEIQADLQDDKPLERRQIIVLALAGAGAFFVFLFLFFPFDSIVRSLLKSRLPGGTRLEFTDLRPSLLGSTKAEGLIIAREPGFKLEAESATLEMKLMALLRMSPRGSLRLNQGSFSGGPLSGSFKAVDVVLDLNDVATRPPREWEGTAQIRVNQFEPDQMPQIPILQKVPLPLSDIVISRLQLKVTFSGGSMHINQADLQSTLFQLRLEGTGRPVQDLSSMPMDGRICVKPVDDLESRNGMVAMLYNTVSGGGTGETCFKVSGSLAAPSFAPAGAGN